MANRLKELRELRGLTQEKLGELVGTSGQQISRLENGQRKMPPEWLDRLAPALAIRPAALIDTTIELTTETKSDGEPADGDDVRAWITLWEVLPGHVRGPMLDLVRASVEILRGDKAV